MLISVIIPTLNEEHTIAETIASVREQGECEIIVVDGGSEDRTRKQTISADQCVTSSTGRAIQQNAGAKASQGDVLLFLHSDCQLQPGALELLREWCSTQPELKAGCFHQQIDAEGRKYRLLEWGNDLRVKWFGWAYGDQGIFVRRELFEQVGGFPEVPLMEDLYLMKQLKRKTRITILNASIKVSPRRWQQRGVLRQTVRNWLFITLAHCGISLETLARHYPHVR